MFYFLLFFEGVIGLSYQLLFFRQVEPYVGYSSETTGWVIGFFLLALALGYKVGGKTCGAPTRRLGYNFIKTSLVGGLGTSAVLLGGYFTVAIPFLGRIGALCVFCALVVAPIAYWMAQSIPLLIQSKKWGEQAAAQGGNALFLSTLGSTAGAIGTPNVLFLVLGASLTLLVVSVLAFGVGFFLAFKGSGRGGEDISSSTKALYLALGTVSIIGVIGFNSAPYLSSTPYLSSMYQDMYVYQKEAQRYLVANQLVMSTNDMENRNKAWYIEETARLMDEYKIESSDVLVLGAGGFMLHRADKRKNNYTYVDIDGQLPDFVGKHFNPDTPKSGFVAQDARAYLIENQKTFDVIYLDTFSSRHALPRHLLTVEYFKLLKQRVKPDGLLLINAVLDPSFNDAYSRNFHTTLTNVFPYCLGVWGKKIQNATNVIYHCHNRHSERVLYTDNINQAERDSIKSLGR